VRDKIYAYALPPEIVVKDGKMDTLLGLLFVNRQLRAECLEAIGSSTYEKHLKLRYTSITSLVKGLEASQISVSHASAISQSTAPGLITATVIVTPSPAPILAISVPLSSKEGIAAGLRSNTTVSLAPPSTSAN
jgi:hypothetical protein